MARRNSRDAARLIVVTRKPSVLHRSTELIWAAADHAERPILPEDHSGAVHQHHPVVGAAVGIGIEFGIGIGAVGCFGLAPGRAGAGHQSERADALRIVRTDDGIRREVSRTQAKLPDDSAVWRDFYHTIVELVSDQGITGAIEAVVFAVCRDETECDDTRDKKRGHQKAMEDLESWTRHCSSPPKTPDRVTSKRAEPHRGSAARERSRFAELRPDSASAKTRSLAERPRVGGRCG